MGNLIGIGMVEESFKGLQEGISFNVFDGEIKMLITLNNPSSIEKQSVQSGPIKLNIGELGNVGFITAEMTGVCYPIADIAIRSLGNHEFPKLEEGYGYALSIILADVPSGEIKALRVVGLSYEFSMKIKELSEKYNNLTTEELITRVRSVQDKYTSYEIKHNMNRIQYIVGTSKN